MGSLRGLLYKDVIGEDFPDMVVMSGFGSTRIYSDKLNATLQFITTEKIYDGKTFSDFYQASPQHVATAVSYDGFASAPRNAGSYSVTIDVDDPNYWIFRTNFTTLPLESLPFIPRQSLPRAAYLYHRRNAS